MITFQKSSPSRKAMVEASPSSRGPSTLSHLHLPPSLHSHSSLYVNMLQMPKTPRADRVGDFRLISLSNKIYLVIAKVLANRLRGLLGTLISPLQSAFIPGRQTSDSVVIAEEIIDAWRKSDTARFIWKVDFDKTYDSLY